VRPYLKFREMPNLSNGHRLAGLGPSALAGIQRLTGYQVCHPTTEDTAMSHMKRPAARIHGLLIGLACAAPAGAAVTVQSKLTIDGTGAMAMASLTSNMTEVIDGDRSRSETQLKFDSGLIQAVARGAAGDQIEIVNLQAEKILQLNPRKRRYTEWSFADMRAQLSKIQSMRSGPGVPVAFDDSQCAWSPASSRSTRRGRSSVAGVDTEQWNITATQICSDRKTGRKCEMELDMNFWLGRSSKTDDQRQRFYRRYAEKLGLQQPNNKAVQERAQAMFGRYDGLWQESSRRLAALQGSVMRSEYALALGGPECADAPGNVAATASMPGEASTGDVGREMATVATSTAVTEKTGRWRLGDLSGELVGKLLSKKKKPAAQDSSATANKSGSSPLLRLNFEILSVQETTADATLFEVPSNYRLNK
jgi:hypothetical protein